MSIDRRKFIRGAVLASSALSTGSLFIGCKTLNKGSLPDSSRLNYGPINQYVPKRVSWSSLSNSDKQAFIDAVKKLKTSTVEVPENFGTTGPRQMDRWAAQAETHRWYCGQNHGSWSFLPWHRAYLYNFELYLRRNIRDSFRLPYWDWEKEQSVPIELQDSELMTKLEIQRTGNTTATGLAAGDFMSSEWWRGVSSEILADTDYDSIGGDRTSNGSIEHPSHNMVHVALGGDMGLIETAAKDPAFWLHHCNIDRLWSQWMDAIIESGNVRMLFPSANVSEWLDTSFTNHFWGPDGNLVSSTLRNSLFTESLDYNYDTMSKTWDVSDIPKDLEIREESAPLTAVDTSAEGLGLTSDPGSVLSINFAFPRNVVASQSYLNSLRLKCDGIPVPDRDGVSYKVDMMLRGQNFQLAELSFFKGKDQKAHHHHRSTAFSLNQYANQIANIAGGSAEGQLIFSAINKNGQKIRFDDAVANFDSNLANYSVKFKAVYR